MLSPIIKVNTFKPNLALKDREKSEKAPRSAPQPKINRATIPNRRKSTPTLKVIGLKECSHQKPHYLKKTHNNKLPRGCDVRNFLQNKNLRKRSIEIAKILNRKCSMKGFTSITTETFRRQHTQIAGSKRTFYYHLKYLFENHVICIIDDYYDPQTGTQRRIIVTAEYYHKALDYFNSMRDSEDPRMECRVGQKICKMIKSWFQKHPVVLAASSEEKGVKNCTHSSIYNSKDSMLKKGPPAGPAERGHPLFKNPEGTTPNKTLSPTKTNRTNSLKSAKKSKKIIYKLTDFDKKQMEAFVRKQNRLECGLDDLILVIQTFKKGYRLSQTGQTNVQKPKKQPNETIVIEETFIEFEKKPIIEEVIAFEDDMLDPITFEDNDTFTRPRSFDPTGFTEEELMILDMTAKNLRKAQEYHSKNSIATRINYART